jgi:4-carboxymuconolactone decarboxylase
MARLPNLEKDQLKPEDLKFYDVIVESRGGVRGPYGVLLHSLDLAARVAHTGSYVRYNLDLPEALCETIIIATAREIKNQL